ncbi:hypothetical protein GCM10011609_14390 [Lentzea pudingi]|uniref:Uncharacterized protein n=1 Tax=Lentzea pudingi TaxID=1789439 RepID=A0ABQ2HG54_9PSEU|nr:hypothetical protein GCM10011609_14390 [Lentzea pudingi]
MLVLAGCSGTGAPAPRATTTTAAASSTQSGAKMPKFVVSQSEAAGSTPDPKTKITLGAVKFGEPTGASGCKS